ncbi:MAG: coenzyme F420-0:L-glutamate ligase [Allobranchiibius sp.]
MSPAKVDQMAGVSIMGVPGLPEILAGDDLVELIVAALSSVGRSVQDGDIVVVTSKVVSKALGLQAEPIDRAALVIAESTAVVAERRTADSVTRVVAARSGPVMAGAGIDASNAGDDLLLLLPRDPDAAAADLHRQFAARTSARLAVLLSDTSGRPWRAGLTDFALGCSGLMTLDDLRGHADADGRDMAVTVRCLADEIAAAADLVKGKIDRVPVAIIRGLAHLVVPPDADTPARNLVRTGPSDWFALGRAEAVRDALGIHAGSPQSQHVGIEPVAAEPIAERMARAVRVALHGEDVAAVDIDPVELLLTVSADEPVGLGRVWARLEVAFAGERLACSAVRGPGGHTSVTLQVRER